MCGLGRLFHCLEDSIYRTHFIFPHTLSVAGEWLLVEHLTSLSLHSLVYSLKHFLSSMPSFTNHHLCARCIAQRCCGGNLCSSSFLVHSSSLWLHQSPHHQSSTSSFLILPSLHNSFSGCPCVGGAWRQHACISGCWEHFILFFSPLTDMLKSVFVPVLYSGEVWKLPARWYER